MLPPSHTELPANPGHHLLKQNQRKLTGDGMMGTRPEKIARLTGDTWDTRDTWEGLMEGG